MMSNPKYNVNDVVYLRESAALGFLEAMRINSVNNSDISSGWLYTLSASQLQPIAASHYGEMITSTYGRGSIHSSSGAQVYFTEDEFVSLCEALDLIRAVLQARLSKVEAQIADLCEETT